MPTLEWFESDGSTPLALENLGAIPPGDSYSGLNAGVAYQAVLKNTSEETIDDITISIEQNGGSISYLYLSIATGETQPAPGSSWHDHEDELLEIGSLEADEAVNIWIDAIIPISAPRQVEVLASLFARAPDPAS